MHPKIVGTYHFRLPWPTREIWKEIADQLSSFFHKETKNQKSSDRSQKLTIRKTGALSLLHRKLVTISLHLDSSTEN